MPKVPSLLMSAPARIAAGVAIGLTLVALAGCAKDDPVTSTATTAPATSAVTKPGTAPGTTRGTATPRSSAGTIPGTTQKPATSTTTTASTTRPSTSAAPGSSTPPTTAPTTPDGFAKALVEAWKAGDQAAAANVAEAPAVAKLFAATDQDPASYVFLDCGGAAGSTICRFNSGSETLLVSVRNTTGGLPMIVTDVRITGAGG